MSIFTAHAGPPEEGLENPPTRAAEHLTENIKRIVKAARGGALRKRSMTEPVVSCAFICIHQNIVRLAELFEFVFGLRVLRVLVGMKFDRELAISALHLFAGRVATDAEDLVIIALLRGHVT